LGRKLRSGALWLWTRISPLILEKIVLVVKKPLAFLFKLSLLCPFETLDKNQSIGILAFISYPIGFTLTFPLYPFILLLFQCPLVINYD
jgi:hypothetical protein